MPTLSAFDYLLSFRNATAERLVSPTIQRFIQADFEHGGVLTSTLLAYVDSNMNVPAMSNRLYIHTNTVRYRLHSIADQTGLNLRQLDDVLELVLAIRLAQPRGGPASRHLGLAGSAPRLLDRGRPYGCRD